MADNSAIEWTDATVNFWWGCTKVGPGCDHCYAEAWDKRTGGAHWGLGSQRRQIGSATALMHRLNKGHDKFFAEYGRFRRVFIQSMSDLFDLEVDVEWFRESWRLIEASGNLDIQIVTKRISTVEKRLAEIGATAWPDHAGLIITVVNQAEVDRDIPRLLSLKRRFCIPWVGLSCEPLLGPIDVRVWMQTVPSLDWVIAGGESGPNARSMHQQWPRRLRDQCQSAGVPFLFKQWGEWMPHTALAGDDLGGEVRAGRVHIVHPTGQSDLEIFEWTGGRNTIPGSRYMKRVGKKAAGRLLDGVEYNGFPAVRA